MSTGTNANNGLKAFYTPDELAELLAISKTTIYRMVGKRQLPFHKIGGVLRFKRDDLEKYLEEGRVGPVKC